VKAECSQHGDVLHIHALHKSSGVVFVKFRTSASAQLVRNNLNLRWFAGKQITAEFVDAAAYNMRFSDA
jgi:RNA-binding protein 39